MELFSSLGTSLITLFVILSVAAIALLLAYFLRLAYIARKSRAQDDRIARRDAEIAAQMEADGFTPNEARDAISQLPRLQE